MFGTKKRLAALEAQQQALASRLDSLLTKLEQKPHNDKADAALEAFVSVAKTSVENAPKAYELLGSLMATMGEMFIRNSATAWGKVGGKARQKRKQEQAAKESKAAALVELEREFGALAASCAECQQQILGVAFGARTAPKADAVKHRDGGHEAHVAAMMKKWDELKNGVAPVEQQQDLPGYRELV